MQVIKLVWHCTVAQVLGIAVLKCILIGLTLFRFSNVDIAVH